MGRFVAPPLRQPTLPADQAAPRVVDPRRGTGLAVGYGVLAALLVLAWGAWRGYEVALSPLELMGLVGLSACAGQVAVLIGPRSWYTPTTPLVALAGLVGGPIAGALAGAASEALAVNRVWQHRLYGAGRSAIEGLAAGVVGLLSLTGARGDALRVALALAVVLVLSQITRLLVVYVRGIQPAGAAIRAGVITDVVEAVIVLPVVAALVATQERSPVMTVAAVASLIALLALAERAHTRQSALLELERAVARTDALTSAPNRLALDEAIVLEHARIVRGARPAGLFIVDLDHFKLANDHHGHDVGDAVLIETVTRLRTGLRETDLVARWGGDELIVLAPEIGGPEQLQTYGERVRQLVGVQPFRVPEGAEIRVTASVGGTLLDGSTPPDVVLKRADVAVYRAKQTRDSCVVEIPASARPLSLVQTSLAESF
jgi:diguanylate cyclase (GGDEF)-like protein